MKTYIWLILIVCLILFFIAALIVVREGRPDDCPAPRLIVEKSEPIIKTETVTTTVTVPIYTQDEISIKALNKEIQNLQRELEGKKSEIANLIIQAQLCQQQ